MTVVEEPGESRFVLDAGDGEAELVFRSEHGHLVLVHTGVPPPLQGHGAGGRLVEAAVDRARRTGEVVVPLCPFAARWLRRHPHVASSVTIEWPDRET